MHAQDQCITAPRLAHLLLGWPTRQRLQIQMTQGQQPWGVGNHVATGRGSSAAASHPWHWPGLPTTAVVQVSPLEARLAGKEYSVPSVLLSPPLHGGAL